MDLKGKKVEIINPGCNYPIKIGENGKHSAKNIYGKCFQN